MEQTKQRKLYGIDLQFNKKFKIPDDAKAELLNLTKKQVDRAIEHEGRTPDGESFVEIDENYQPLDDDGNPDGELVELVWVKQYAV